MLYILESNTFLSPQFNLSLGNREDQFTSVRNKGYENADKLILQSSITGLDVFILDEPVEFFSKENYCDVLASSTYKKDPDLNKIPDFWSQRPIPVVSEKFKSLIEKIDEVEHQFYELPLYVGKTGESIIADKYYFFICCRLAKLEADEKPAQKYSYAEAGSSISGEELNRLATIQRNQAVQEVLEAAPIWRDFNTRTIHYINENFLKVCQKAGLKGFKESSYSKSNVFTRRDVGYVRY